MRSDLVGRERLKTSMNHERGRGAAQVGPANDTIRPSAATRTAARGLRLDNKTLVGCLLFPFPGTLRPAFF